jgi:hypothetical protein
MFLDLPSADGWEETLQSNDLFKQKRIDGMVCRNHLLLTKTPSFPCRYTHFLLAKSYFFG